MSLPANLRLARRLSLRFALAFACFFSLYGEAWAQPEPGWEDFSSAGSVIYAGIYYPNQGPSNAFDGVGTYYSGTAASSPHVGIDARLPRILRYIEARGTASFSFVGRIRFSDDGVTFTDTATTVSVPANDGSWHQFPVPDYGAHRYWVIADLQDDTYLQIDELRMYAPPAGTPPPSNLEDVTSVGNFIVGGANYPGQGGSNAFNAPGLWYSGTTSNGTYVGRDFGTPREVRRIDATGTSSFSFSGRVRYSDDGVTFFDTAATIYVGPGTSAPVSTLIPEVYGAHRYWVIADLQDDAYLQIDELTLYAVAADPPPSPGELEDVTGLGTLVSGGGSYPEQGPENAFNAPGAWYSGTSSNETYVGRDLATARSLRRIDVTGTASFSFYGRVKYSDDGMTWTNTSTTIDVPAGSSMQQSFTIQDYGQHRYWAVFDLQDDAYLQVDEIRLFAAPPPPAPPQLTAPVASPLGGVYANPQAVSLSASVGATIRYTTDGSEPTSVSNVYVQPIPVNSGTVIIKAQAFQPDVIASPVQTDTYVIDTVAPTIAAARFPAMISGWHNAPTTVSFTCSDNVGIASCTGTTVFNSEGASQNIVGSAIDLAGRQTNITVTVNLDSTPPQLALTSPAGPMSTSDSTIQLSGDVADALSGVAAVTCNGQTASLNAGVMTCTASLRPGINDLVIAARDAAGNAVSKGVRVTRVGPPTQIGLTPGSRTVLVGEGTSFALTDEFGVVIVGATWTSSDPQVVAISADDPPLLTALQPGAITVTATAGGLSAAASLTVLGGTSLPDGTTRWAMGNVAASLTTNRVDLTVPDLFTVESSAAGTFVRGVSASGDVQSLMAAPAVPFMADSFGASSVARAIRLIRPLAPNLRRTSASPGRMAWCPGVTSLEAN